MFFSEKIYFLMNERKKYFLCFEQIKRERQDVELGIEHKSNKEPLPAIQTLPFSSILCKIHID